MGRMRFHWIADLSLACSGCCSLGVLLFSFSCIQIWRSWASHASWQPWIWKFKNLEILEPGNLESPEWKLSEWKYVLPKMFARSWLVVEKVSRPHLGQCSTFFLWSREIIIWCFLWLFSLVVQLGPIHPVGVSSVVIQSFLHQDLTAACQVALNYRGIPTGRSWTNSISGSLYNTPKVDKQSGEGPIRPNLHIQLTKDHTAVRKCQHGVKSRDLTQFDTFLMDGTFCFGKLRFLEKRLASFSISSKTWFWKSPPSFPNFRKNIGFETNQAWEQLAHFKVQIDLTSHSHVFWHKW